MGAAKDFVFATIADAVAPTFRRPVEDIIYETLDRRQVPTRTDFKELRDLINNLRGQISGATQGIKKLASSNESVDETLQTIEEKVANFEEKSQFLETIEQQLAELKKENQQLQQKLAQLEEKKSSGNNQTEAFDSAELKKYIVEIVSAMNTPMAKTNPEYCKLPTCKEKSRARGFCAKCYQKWRRGTLPGFISLGGELKHKGRKLQFDSDLEGEPYEILDGKVLVNGESFDF